MTCDTCVCCWEEVNNVPINYDTCIDLEISNESYTEEYARRVCHWILFTQCSRSWWVEQNERKDYLVEQKSSIDK